MRLRRILAPGILALALVAPAPAAAGAPRWQWRSASPIKFQRLTLLGTLVVSTSDSLVSIDPETGVTQWSRGDVRGLAAPDLEEIPGTSAALLHLGAGTGGLRRHVEVIDLATGARLWDSHALPIASVHGAFAAPGRGLLVLVGSARHGAPLLLGVDLGNGAVRWRQDAIFDKPPPLRRLHGSGGMTYRLVLEGDMPALLDGPDRMILWVSADGPMALDLSSGRRLWSAPIEGPPPSRAAGHAAWVLAGRTIYAPFGRTLYGLDAASGLVLWKTDSPFPAAIGRMQPTSRGLVVFGAPVGHGGGREEGRPFLDLVDTAIGRSRWRFKPPRIENPGAFAVMGETLYVASDRELLAVTLADGEARKIASLDLRGNETVTGLESVEGDLVATSSQTTMRLGTRGQQRYARYDPAPMAAAWARVADVLDAAVTDLLSLQELAHQVASGLAMVDPGPGGHIEFVGAPLLTKRYKASREAGACRVVLTQVEQDGRSAIGLLRIDKASGQPRGSLPLGDRTPDFVYDPVANLLCVRMGGHEIRSFAF